MYVMFVGKLLLMTSPVFNKCRQVMFNNFQCWTDPSYFQNKVMKSEFNFSACYTVSLMCCFKTQRSRKQYCFHNSNTGFTYHQLDLLHL
jgi:hypothetical protein